ncbi:MAG: HAMP domain-containing protein [Planctomycetes bacterium]|nr:HAMP domain-containing protein [Planctomycetota bacterium]
MGGMRLYFVLIVAVLLSGLAALLPVVWTGAGVLESSYREYAVKDMTANARLFALAVLPELDGKADLQRVMAAAREMSDTRFTVISAEGVVLAETEDSPERMENHANRPEVRSALAGEVGMDIRRSSTLGIDWMYVAVPVAGGRVVRAAASLDDLNRRLAQWWRRAGVGFFLSVVVLLALALCIARFLARPLETAARGAARYAGGDFSYRLPVAGSAEMRDLNASLNAMAEQLDDRFRQILRQREEMRTIFENMTEGVLAVSPDGRIMVMNAAAENLLLLEEEVTGRGIESVTRSPDLLAVLRETAHADGPLEREIRLPGKTGDEILVMVHAARIREDGRDTGVLAVLRDITRLRQLEIMRRDFVANVSHELRTPVTTILSCLEMLTEEKVGDDDHNAELLEMALRNARRLGAIIGNLLLLAGMESGEERDTGTATVSPVRPVLDEALSICGEAAAARGVSIEVHCADTTTAFMNPRLVVHALVNLVDNAVKYGPEGGTVTVTAEPSEGQTVITVTDEGPGIPPRFQARVFERFYRIDGSSRLKEGAGLGLALVKHIALAQKGNVTLTSRIGAGSSFSLSLPGPPETTEA